MKVYLATNFLGCFAFDGSGKLVAFEAFRKDPQYIAKQLSEEGMISEEEKLLKQVRKAEVFWPKEAVKGIGQDRKGEAFLKEQFREIATGRKIVKDQAELNMLITKVNIALTGKSTRKQGRDKILMKVVGIVDELDEVLNNLSERTKEWYGLYFPESLGVVKDHKAFMDIISKTPEKGSMTDSKLKDIAGRSSGMDFSKVDLESVSGFSSALKQLYESRDMLAGYVDRTAKAVIPNMSALAGSLLAARLLERAGGLDRISKMPSSKIQLLGAEKALFRHLRGEGKAPKYGIIFGHALVQKAPKPLKGKVARLVASKICIAAKMDRYSGEDRSGPMLKDLEKKAESIIGSRSS